MSKRQSMSKKTGATKTKQAPKKNAAGNNTRSKPAGRSYFQQHQEVAVDSLSRLLLEPASSLLTWCVIGIALALPLCLLLFLDNMRQFDTSLDEAGNLSVFMELETSPGELEAVHNRLAGLPQVSAVTLLTAEQALEEFRRGSGFGDALNGLDENPLPPLFVVTPAEADIGVIRTLARELEDWEGVDYVQIDLEWIQRLYGIIALAQRLTTGLAVLLCLGVILVIGNTVRLAIENRRDEILVVKLVGGTDAYVSRPFLYTGLWYGVGGGLVAAALAVLAILFLNGPVGRLMDSYDSSFKLTGLSVSELLLLLMVAGGLGLAGAWLSVIRHLRRIEPR